MIFHRSDLIEKKVTRVRTAKKIQDKYLNLEYDKDVVILRILDSKKENFKLGNLYSERFEVKNCITDPEVEILMIINKGDYNKFSRTSNVKASNFASQNYKIRNIKNTGIMEAFFDDVDELIKALKDHKRVKGKDHYTIYDLVK